jgi:hypothetical protein
MYIELNIPVIREKAIMLIPEKLEKRFKNDFDTETYLDLIENPEDYIAEGLASAFLNKIEK